MSAPLAKAAVLRFVRALGAAWKEQARALAREEQAEARAWADAAVMVASEIDRAFSEPCVSVDPALHALATAAHVSSRGPWWNALDLEREAFAAEDALFIAALSPDVVLALLDRLERAERITPSVEAGEVVDAVLSQYSYDECLTHNAARIVQRALDAAEERGATDALVAAVGAS